MSEQFRIEALSYHQNPRPGKTGTFSTKNASTTADLSLAYTPGVGFPVLEIQKDPAAAYRYTNKGNLVAVISDGSAVLGLGDCGALASKPVMEGKAVLFKTLADVDVFDLEVQSQSVDQFVEVVAAIAPTFGGINLEDIKAPNCFEIERKLIERLDIPVFHDDQHGTAVVVSAALTNALLVQEKSLTDIRVVCLGAGAAGIASMEFLTQIGLPREAITLIDSKGVVHRHRSDLGPYKAAFAKETSLRTVEEALVGADVFIGLAGPDLLSPAMLKKMAKRPIIFALSNPKPEIFPEQVIQIRADAVVSTGRGDYPNQVNNALCFPYLFRGALDVRASRITLSMQMAAASAISALARMPLPDELRPLYLENGAGSSFGPSFILPKILDPRLRKHVSEAVASAAVSSGVSRVGALSKKS